jgi:hypothetical protein
MAIERLDQTLPSPLLTSNETAAASSSDLASSETTLPFSFHDDLEKSLPPSDMDAGASLRAELKEGGELGNVTESTASGKFYNFTAAYPTDDRHC